MAARRAGFDGFFTPLYAVDKLKTGLLDGTLSGIPFFAQQVLPLIKAQQSGDKFAIAQIVRKYSPILKNEALKDSQRPLDEIRKANSAVESLYALWNEGHDPTLIDILKQVTQNSLFRVPDVLVPIASREETPNKTTVPVSENEEPDRDAVIDAWDEALSNPFSQIEAYVDYISDQSRFGTHQGIKGLEFPRVMVILDDSEARGFLFSYEKLFGAKAPTATDLRNQSDGKETSIDRTRRLFYVTCSRTKESLAIVAYTNEPAKVKSHVIEHGWFGEAEVIEL
jgi:DNA helicase-2/ATP-dependent DNA helicase PcrA